MFIPPEDYFRTDMVLRQFPSQWIFTHSTPRMAAQTEVTQTQPDTSPWHSLELHSLFKPASSELVQDVS